MNNVSSLRTRCSWKCIHGLIVVGTIVLLILMASAIPAAGFAPNDKSEDLRLKAEQNNVSAFITRGMNGYTPSVPVRAGSGFGSVDSGGGGLGVGLSGLPSVLRAYFARIDEVHALNCQIGG